MLDFTTFNLSKCNISCKKSFLNLASNLSYFWDGIWKQYCHIWNQHPRICQTEKFHEKINMPKFGDKNVLFGYFEAWILKTYYHIWNQHPRICQIAEFHKNMKMPKFAIKNALFGYFLTHIWEEYCHIWNQHPRICIIAKFREKTKYALIWDQKIPYLAIFGMQFENNIVIFWNEHPRICQIGRFHEKKKMPKFGTKNALCVFFWLEFEKSIVISEINILEFV